jgi:hypothetical protein
MGLQNKSVFTTTKNTRLNVGAKEKIPLTKEVGDFISLAGKKAEHYASASTVLSATTRPL